MPKIKKITAREILDSRGNPTVEADVWCDDGTHAWSQVPSGASTGAHEAWELRDSDPQRFGGKGVLRAVEHVKTEIAHALIGTDVLEQKKIDEVMIALDGTENKARLGANAILSVSLAVCRAGAIASGVPLYAYIREKYNPKTKNYTLPVPMFNIVNGGVHADSGLSIQEYKMVPRGIVSFAKQYQAGSEIFHALKKILSSEGYATSVGDEGGFAPRLAQNAAPFVLIARAAEEAGYAMGREVFIGIDAAANSFYKKEEDRYVLALEKSVMTREMLVALYDEWVIKHHLMSVEDGLHEEDWDGWRGMRERIGTKTLLIGDDLLVTNVDRLTKAIAEKACTAVLIKPNQIGTVTETLACMALAKKNKMVTVVSHRSGETVDDFIADLAVGAGAAYIKTGAPSRGERVCKYNRLLRIEEEITR